MVKKPDKPIHDEITCPECGRKSSDASIPKSASLFNWQRIVPLLVLICFATGLVIWIISVSIIYPASTFASAHRLIDPIFSYADIKRIANGDTVKTGNVDDIELIEIVADTANDLTFDFTPGENWLAVLFGSEATERIKTKSMGWPSAWYRKVERLNYENAITRTGFLPAITDTEAEPYDPLKWPQDPLLIPTRQLWNWGYYGIVHQPPPEQTNGITTYTKFNSYAIAPLIAAMMFVWLVISVFNYCIRRLFKTSKIRINRVIKLVSVLLVAFVILFLEINHSETSDVCFIQWANIQKKTSASGFTYYGREGTSRTSFTFTDINNLKNTADGSQQIAKEILRVHPSIDGDPESMYLAISYHPEAIITSGTISFSNGGSPFMTVAQRQFRRFTDAGNDEFMTMPEGFSFSLQDAFLTINYSTGNPKDYINQISIDIEFISVIFITVCMLWLFSRFICRRSFRMIVNRRRKQGRCACCCYILDPVKS